MPLNLLGDACLVRCLHTAEEAASSILYVPTSKDDKKRLPAFGVLEQHGPGRKAVDGKRVPFVDAYIGSVVVYLRGYAAGEYADGDDRMDIVHDYDILARVAYSEQKNGRVTNGTLTPNWGYTVLAPESEDITQMAAGIFIVGLKKEQAKDKMGPATVIGVNASLRETIGPAPGGRRRTLEYHGFQEPEFLAGDRVIYDRFGVWYVKFSDSGKTFAIVNNQRIAGIIENGADVVCR